jgi:hypothetical protein
MTLPASGAISLTDVMAELRTVNPSRAYPITLGDSDVRALAQVPSGPISLTSLYGKSAYVPMSGSIPTVNANAAGNVGFPYTAHANVSISLSGGKAPFSYAWSHLSGDGGITAANAATVTASFAISRYAASGDNFSQAVQCIVTDVTGAQFPCSGTVNLTLT